MKQELNFKLSKNSEIFGIVKNDKKFIIVVGQYKAVKKEFDTIGQAEQYIGTKPYELIFNTMQIMFDYAKEAKKQTSKKTSKDTKNNHKILNSNKNELPNNETKS